MTPTSPCAQLQKRNMFRLRKWLLSQYFKLMATPKKERKFTVDDLCRRAGISRKTLYKWKKRYLKEGDAGLYDRSRKPKNTHHTPALVVSIIYDIRERFGWGAKKIAAYMKRKYKLNVSHTTVHKYLKQGGFVRRQKQKHYRRWERKKPNELWQIDISGSGRLDILDDASRFLIASVKLERATSDIINQIVEESFIRFGPPREILSDHGTQFFSVRGGTSSFDRLCEKWGVKHILARVRHPQTIGKVERVHRTIDRESKRLNMGLMKYSEHYNYERPHGGIGYATPAEKYFNGRNLKIHSVTHLP